MLLLLILRLVNALMAEAISAKVGQGIFLMFLHLLALRNGRSKSLDAGYVRYPVAIFILALSKAVATDIQTRQRPA